MTSSAPSTSAYAYQKPSTIATRSLVSGTKPAETTSASSHDVDTTSDRPTLQRKTTDHYQQAVQTAAAATATKADSGSAHELGSSVTKPALERQQSWKHSDLKRGAMEKILGDNSGGAGHGYSTTSTAT